MPARFRPSCFMVAIVSATVMERANRQCGGTITAEVLDKDNTTGLAGVLVRAILNDAGAGSRFSTEVRIPLQIGAPGGIRTPDHRLRRPPLYPAELQARFGAV